MSELYLNAEQQPPKKVLLLGLDLGKFDPDRSMEELSALAEANNMEPVAQLVQKRAAPEAGTVLGEGKLAEAALYCHTLEAEAAIFDGVLTGSQPLDINIRTKCRQCQFAQIVFASLHSHTVSFIFIYIRKIQIVWKVLHINIRIYKRKHTLTIFLDHTADRNGRIFFCQLASGIVKILGQIDLLLNIRLRSLYRNRNLN